ncbi:MAG TPA: VWA domain-containing protein [Bryobacteraceae bacterium]
MSAYSLAWIAVFLSATAFAQNTPKQQDSLKTGESVASFQGGVELVLVPVVVRDRQGKPVGNLTKDDFQLFDKKKQQTVVSFAAVGRAGTSAGKARNMKSPPAEASHTADTASVAESRAPARFVIYLFDDLDSRVPDLAHVRGMAIQHFDRELAPGDRAAIYTFSGRPALDFTSDRDKLEGALAKVRTRESFAHDETECPGVTYYLADLILNRDDPYAKKGLVRHTMACTPCDEVTAEMIVMAAAERRLHVDEPEHRVAFRTLRYAIRRLAQMPGERLIVLASSGFYAQTREALGEMAEILNLAAKDRVTISSLYARGVYSNEPDAADPRMPSQLWLKYRELSSLANKGVLTDLAEGTGGTMSTEFERVADAPEFCYVLGFAPVNLKQDGSFHAIKIRLANVREARIEARRGYYALKDEPEEQEARSAMDDALFSHNEVHEIPVILQTGYVKPKTGDPKVTVMAKTEFQSLHFAKAAARSHDSLVMVAALFNRDGRYLTGTTKTANLNLLEETLAKKDAGVTLRWDFPVKPGAYVIRLVVRETQGKEMSEFSRPVTIP